MLWMSSLKRAKRLSVVWRWFDAVNQRFRLRRVIWALLCLSLLLSSCASSPVHTLPPLPSPRPTLSPTPAATLELTPTPPPSPTLTPTPLFTPTLTPLPERRLPAEDWRTWPDVIPLSNTARAVYLRSLAAGHDPHAFSILGDTWWAYPAADFDPFAAGGVLSEAARWYWPSFGRRGTAWLPGLTPQALFLPERADPQVCAPGEIPLDCELRSHNAALAFIHFQGASKGFNEAEMAPLYRAIVERTLAADVLPVLVLNAGLSYGDDGLNGLLARLAYEYDLPVWNLAAVYRRQESFDRLSVLSVLAALNADFQGLLTVDDVPALSPLPRPPLSAGRSQRLLLGLRQRTLADGVLQDAGVFLLDLQTRQKTQLLSAGYGLQALAPDGQTLLANEGRRLWRVWLNGAKPPLLLSEALSTLGEGQHAVFLPDGSGILAVLDQDGQRSLWRLRDGLPPDLLSPSGVPVLQVEDVRAGRVYWSSGSCLNDTCRVEQVWQTDLQTGRSSADWNGMLHVRFSADGAYAAYRFLNQDGRSELGVTPLDRSWVWTLTMPGDPIPNFSKPRPLLSAFDWSPDGQQLAMLFLERSFYSGTLAFNRLFVADPHSLRTQELPFHLAGQQARLTWSPSGERMAVSATRRRADTFAFVVGLRLVDANGQLDDLDDVLAFEQADFVYIERLLWLPPEE